MSQDFNVSLIVLLEKLGGHQCDQILGTQGLLQHALLLHTPLAVYKANKNPSLLF